MISLDCETNGLDFHHGARPFFVTTCSEDGEQKYWEWPVDPLTREVEIPELDLEEICDLVFELVGDDGPRIVMQNGKFDVTALSTILEEFTWPWDRCEDTLIAGHLLASNKPHDLTSMAIQYLGRDIQPFEDRLETAVKKARTICRSEFPQWKLAKKDQEGMPSAKEEAWKLDTWLPAALCREWEDDDHEWTRVLADYSNADSAITLLLWQVIEGELKQRGLWEIYRESMRVSAVVSKMETWGVTLSKSRLGDLEQEYRTKSDRLGKQIVNIAKKKGFDLILPKGAAPNKSVRTFCFDVLKLEHIRQPKSKTTAPSLDAKVAIPYYLDTLPQGSDELLWMSSYARKKRYDTSLTFMAAYRRFWLPTEDEDTVILFPSVNQTGSGTLRFSMSNPNAQQVSKQEVICPTCRGEGCEECGYSGEDLHSLRRVFGPAPGREWWSLDYENLELRIPAYKSNERVMIDLFEKPDDAPYFGSNHLLCAHILHPDLFNQCLDGQGKISGKVFKKRHEAEYKRTKNGNFAIQYGAIERSGTADRAYGVRGAQGRIQKRLGKIADLNRSTIQYANKMGYVETLPDKEINPKKGYPLLCTRTDNGRILETVPLSYFVQGTAMWCTRRAMVRCQDQLDQWSREGFGGKMFLQVHDELDFDLPRGGKKNLGKILKLKRLMEQSGDDIGIPLRVSYSYHPNNWAEEGKL